ncbi:hypothetical protein XELAEV_18005356mg [Xenopus laevis]|uniref:Uncharacterized protein n=1 Tax=Xenopus laevis TaxID=8355 RepID=A0A974I2T6_XENLA|nr:hypothetical protein XELAEV_18005356mg [Xenopus laevis]
MRNTYHGQREESIDPASGEETTKAMNGMGGSQQQRMKRYVFTQDVRTGFRPWEQMSDMAVTVCATLPPTVHLKHH